MSRRRQTFTVPAGVTPDDLLTALYGQRTRHERATMPGCVAACCAPGVFVDGEAAPWLVVWLALASDGAVAVAGLAVVACALWWAVGGMP